MLPETLALLAEHDFVRGAESVNRERLADACRELLMANPVQTAEQVQEQALIIAELRHAIFGQVETEEIEADLDTIITPLTGPADKVQMALEGAYVLCTARVIRRLSNDGSGNITLKRPGRFVTDNPDLIEQFFWSPAVKAQVRSLQVVKERLELACQRQPALEARRFAHVELVHRQAQLQLPMAAAVI